MQVMLNLECFGSCTQKETRQIIDQRQDRHTLAL